MNETKQMLTNFLAALNHPHVHCDEELKEEIEDVLAKESEFTNKDDDPYAALGVSPSEPIERRDDE